MAETPQSMSRPAPHPDFGVELVREWTPHDKPQGTVVLVHGIAEHSGRYERTGTLLAEGGLMVRSFDLRGAGASGGRRWDIAYWALFHDQIEPHVRWARDQQRPVVLMGHSLGATLILGYALGDREPADMLVLSSPALTSGARWQRRLAPLLARILPTLPLSNAVKGELLSRDPAVGEAYFADPLVYTKSTPRLGAEFFAAMDRVLARMGDIEIPTLLLHGGDDRLADPQATAGLEDHPLVDRKVYPGLRHEILNEPEGPQVVADIVDWIEAQV